MSLARRPIPCDLECSNFASLELWISVTASLKPIPAKPARHRTDGRRTLLVYLDGDLIKDLKKVALDEERNVYEIVEEASRAWLIRRANRKSKANVYSERKKD
jgi:hypothetical protein